MEVNPNQKIILLDDDRYHLDYLKDRLNEIEVADSQVACFDHPESMPSLNELGEDGSKQVAILSNGHHEIKEDIDKALLAKLHAERDKLDNIETRLGFRSSDIGYDAPDNAPFCKENHEAKTPQRLNPETLGQLHERRSRQSRREFYQGLAKDRQLRPHYLLMMKYGRQAANRPIQEDLIQKDRDALSLLFT